MEIRVEGDIDPLHMPQFIKIEGSEGTTDSPRYIKIVCSDDPSRYITLVCSEDNEMDRTTGADNTAEMEILLDGFLENPQFLQSNVNEPTQETPSTSSQTEIAVKLKCTKCNIEFKDQTQLISHINTTGHMDKNYCIICNKKFVSRIYCIEHLKNVHEQIFYNCQYCNYETRIKKWLEKHIIDKHLKKFECKNCSIIFNNSIELLDHVRNQHESNAYSCRTCDKNFESLKLLKNHQLKIHKNLTFKRKTCIFCNNILNNNEELKKHEKKHHRSLIFKCFGCNKNFDKNFDLQYHTASIHNSIFQCLNCNYITTKNRHMGSHLIHNHGIPYLNNLYASTKRTCLENSDFVQYSGNVKKRSLNKLDESNDNVGKKHKIDSNELQSSTTSNSNEFQTSTNQSNVPVFVYNPFKFDCPICQLKFIKKALLYKHISEEHQIKKNKGRR